MLSAIPRRTLCPPEVPLKLSRTIAASSLGALCSGCFAPFSHDRHDLVDFRIVGVQVSDAAPAPGAAIQAKALVYGGDGFYHDALPSLVWSLGEQRAEGPVVELRAPDQEGSWELELVATHADGQLEERAVLGIQVGEGLDPIRPPALPPVERAVVDLALDSPPEDMLLAARQQLEPRAESAVAEGQAARLRVPLEDPEGRYQARWMSAGGQGTFLELDALSTDWFPAELFLEEEDVELEVGEALEAGMVGMAVLIIDGLGSTAWAFVDTPYDVAPEVGLDGPEHWLEHAGRIVPALSPGTEAAIFELTLERDDDSPWGLRFRDPEVYVPWTGSTAGDNLAIPCEHPIPPRGPFQLDWLAEGLCSREAVLGQRVRMQLNHPLATWGEP